MPGHRRKSSSPPVVGFGISELVGDVVFRYGPTRKPIDLGHGHPESADDAGIEPLHKKSTAPGHRLTGGQSGWLGDVGHHLPRTRDQSGDDGNCPQTGIMPPELPISPEKGNEIGQFANQYTT